jgi:hypothetical protein
MVPIVSLDRMGFLLAQDIEAHGAGFRPLGANAMPDRLLGEPKGSSVTHQRSYWLVNPLFPVFLIEAASANYRRIFDFALPRLAAMIGSAIVLWLPFYFRCQFNHPPDGFSARREVCLAAAPVIHRAQKALRDPHLKWAVLGAPRWPAASLTLKCHLRISCIDNKYISTTNDAGR